MNIEDFIPRQAPPGEYNVNTFWVDDGVRDPLDASVQVMINAFVPEERFDIDSGAEQGGDWQLVVGTPNIRRSSTGSF